MIETSKLYLIRHAEVEKLEGYIPENNANAKINLDHLKILATYIPHNCTCYVSPLKRALQTAKALSKFTNFKELLIDNKLKEQNFGDWGGKKISSVWNEIKMFKKKHNFSFIYPELTPPKGDSFLDQCKRVSKFLQNLKFSNEKSIVIIDHSGTIRAFLCCILNLNPDIAIGINISYLSITSFEILHNPNPKNKGGKYRLLNLNHETNFL